MSSLAPVSSSDDTLASLLEKKRRKRPHDATEIPERKYWEERPSEKSRPVERVEGLFADREEEDEPAARRHSAKSEISRSVVDEAPVDLDAIYQGNQDLVDSVLGAQASMSSECDERKARPPPEWRPYKLKLNPFEGEDQSELEYDPRRPEFGEYCFFCFEQRARSDLSESARYKRLHSFIVKNWGRVSLVFLLNRAQSLYNDTVRKYTKLKYPFFRRNIADHFFFHDPTPRFILEYQEQCIRMIMTEMMQVGDLFEQNIENPRVKRARINPLKTYKEYAQYHRTLFNELVQCRQRAIGGG